VTSGYYDQEAPRYDESRGGVVRARRAADAVAALVPTPGRTLDVGGGTGIVSAELAARGRDVLVVDVSIGMLRLAAQRLPGRAVAGCADRLPVAGACVDLVTAIWLLHLLPAGQADAVISEAARVLRPGGHFVTTVDKPLAHGHEAAEADARDRVRAVAGRAGLTAVGGASFSGPSEWDSATDGDPVFSVVAFRRG
jgi:ubiquinone/menaquinone biosynthesis C-methylase UbiE